MVAAHSLLLLLSLGAGEDLVVLDFTAPWCGACRQMEPVVGQLTRQGVPIRTIDHDQNPELVQQFQVSSLPCFIVLRDGREVGRVVGAKPRELTELLRSLRRASVPDASRRGSSPNPAVSNAASGETRARGGDSPRGLSDAVGIIRDRLTGTMAAAGGARGERTAGSAPPRAITAVSPGVPAITRRALQATVRLKIVDPQGQSYGTGTIVDSHGEEALVLTCGHLFRASRGNGTIAVDLFTAEGVRTVPGQLIAYDSDKRDLGLVSIRPGSAVVAMPVGSPSVRPAVGDRVFSIGCDRGADPSVRASQVSAINKYLGAANIEVAGQPIDGRSGGGLFTEDGVLIGVCNAASQEEDEGLYAALPSIHQTLAEIGQQRVFLEADQEVAASLQRLAVAPARPAETTSAEVAAGRSQERARREPTGAREPIGTVGYLEPARSEDTGRDFSSSGVGREDDEDEEMILIVRSRRDPTAAGRVIVLDRASRELLSQVAVESSRRASPDAGTKARIATRAATGPSRHSPPQRPIIRAQSAE